MGVEFVEGLGDAGDRIVVAGPDGRASHRDGKFPAHAPLDIRHVNGMDFVANSNALDLCFIFQCIKQTPIGVTVVKIILLGPHLFQEPGNGLGCGHLGHCGASQF